MSTYHVKLSGSVKTLADIASAIGKEEALGSKFLFSELAWVQPTFTNLLTFEEIDLGILLKPIAVTKPGDPAPTAHAKIWTGAMVVDGHNDLLTIWRKPS